MRTGHGADRAVDKSRSALLDRSHAIAVRSCLRVAPPPRHRMQLDELWGFVHTKEAHLPGPSSIARPRRRLGMDAFASVWRLVCFRDRQAGPSQSDLLLARVAL